MRLFRQVKSALITLVVVYLLLNVIIYSLQPLMPLIMVILILLVIGGLIFYRRTRI